MSKASPASLHWPPRPYCLAVFGLLVMAAFGSCWPSANRTAAPPTVPSSPGEYRVAFYNVENLYDTADDPANPGDNEFLPTAKKNWTPERYQRKLDHLAKVLEGMAYPAIIGLAEVENAQVLHDLIEKTSLSALGYSFAHFDSPDQRGIDVALLYRSAMFKLQHAEPIRIRFPDGMIPDNPGYTTRDLLHVTGIFAERKLHVVVAHLPSRREGQKETEPRRMYVASQIRALLDRLFAENPDGNYVIMGDMNDEPTDPSMAQTLGALPLDADWQNTALFNCFSKLHAEGKGSYKFRGNWNMLDQIIISGNLMKGTPYGKYSASGIFEADWMMYNDEKYGRSPSRTYGGDHYFGGYSDHLPVFVSWK